MKYELGILKDKIVDWAGVEENVGLSDNKKTAQYIANKSITLVKNQNSLVPLKPSKLKNITHLILTTDDDANSFLKILDSSIQRLIQTRGSRTSKRGPTMLNTEGREAATLHPAESASKSLERSLSMMSTKRCVTTKHTGRDH